MHDLRVIIIYSLFTTHNLGTLEQDHGEIWDDMKVNLCLESWKKKY